MAVQTLAGVSVPWGVLPPSVAVAPAFSTALVIDATGEKVGFSGRVWFAARTGTKAIRKIGFRFGAVTKAGGSGLTVSLQDPTGVTGAGTGGPMVPDETQDQTVAVANGDAAFAANTWYQTGDLSADRTVSFGDKLSICWEYDGGGRLGADTVTIAGLGATQSGHAHSCVAALKTASWAVAAVVPNVILEFSDGTFGTLMGAFPCSAISSIAYNSGSAADEIALEMTWPGPLKIDGVGGIWTPSAAGADFDVVVYDGTSAMSNGTVAVDGDDATGAAQRFGYAQLPGMVTLAANTTYRIALKPNATNITLVYFEVAAAGHFQAHVGGEAWAYTTRVDAGSWAAATTTRRPFLWPYVCAMDDGAGSGGTTIAGTPMRRGMV